MSDQYQAVYDAVRSRFHCDADGAIQSALRDAFGNIDHLVSCVASEYISAAQEQQRPSVLMRPAMSVDGNQWCALYGDNLVDGVCGFGDTPAKAMQDFDKNWNSQVIPGRN